MDAWLLTVPWEQPSASATSVSDRSSQYRRTTTARCLGGSWARAPSSALRSSAQETASSRPAMSGGVSVSASRTRRLRNRSLLQLTSIRRTYASGLSVRETRRQERYAFASAVCVRSSA